MKPEDLLVDSSKLMVIHNAKYISDHPEMFEPMLRIALSSDRRKATRALRALFLIVESNPGIAAPYLGDILESAEACKDESIMFNLLHMFTIVELPEDDEYIGRLTNLCLDWIERKVDRVAIKVYAIETLYQISLIYPEFKQELVLIIRKMQDEKSPGIQSRAKRLLKLLQ